MTFKPVAGFHEVNADLEQLNREFAELSNQIGPARDAYLVAEAEHDLSMAKAMLEYKAAHNDATQTDIRSFAIRQSYTDRMLMIAAESQYRKLAGTARSLEQRLKALCEVSYNLRAESKIR